jgi:type VI secretion system secreted protein VgrG
MAGKRQLGITEPTGDLEIEGMQATERLGRLFEYELSLFSHNESVDIDKVLGQNVTVRLELPGGEDRFFNGHVSRFSQVGRNEQGYATYEASVRPWLWFLTRTADCRIFQEKKVPDIIKEICKEEGFSDIEDKLSGSYRTWVYCVQYRETDFNFISRLMEQEGIYYYFRHEDGKHTLVLCDAPGSHESIGDPIPWRPPGNRPQTGEVCISEWLLSREVKPGAFALNDYDAEKPKASLQARSLVKRNHAAAEYEIYDYPGEYLESADGDQYAGVRIEELHAGFEEVSGNSDSRLMTAGGLFEMEQYPRDDQNREYLITAMTYELTSDAQATGAAAGAPVYNAWFRAIDGKTQFRAPRTTPKPVIQGPQTAVVVGPAGEEIYPDKYGRIKAQFHWDRYGKKDENSSCWIRVAHLWAGKGWGGQHIPRIGQEVMVEFLEGDPDQPIITGRVYNADNMPPYELPGSKTQSGIKSRSTKGGGNDNFNEIRFEDKIGEEELYIQAEKNHTQLTKNDRAETVGNDRSLDVGHDKAESIGNNKAIVVKVDHTETIGSNKTLNVGADHSESIGKNMTITVGSNLTESVVMNYAENVGIAMELTVGAAMAETIGANKEQNIGKDKSISIGKNKSEDVGDSKTVSVGKDQAVKIGKTLTYDVADQITIKTGKASITMKKDGTITIQGKDITLKGSGAINVKASKDVVIKGKKILEN